MQTDNQEEILVELLLPAEDAKEILYQAYLQGYSPETWCAKLITKSLQIIVTPAAALTPEARAAAHRDSYQRPQPADAADDAAEPDFSILGSIHNN